MARIPEMQEQFPVKAMDGPNTGNAGAISGRCPRMDGMPDTRMFQTSVNTSASLWVGALAPPGTSRIPVARSAVLQNEALSTSRGRDRCHRSRETAMRVPAMYDRATATCLRRTSGIQGGSRIAALQRVVQGRRTCVRRGRCADRCVPDRIRKDRDQYDPARSTARAQRVERGHAARRDGRAR